MKPLYYNSDLFKESGSDMSYASSTYQTNYFDGVGHPENSLYYVQQTSVYIYANQYFDMLSINFGDFYDYYATY